MKLSTQPHHMACISKPPLQFPFLTLGHIFIVHLWWPLWFLSFWQMYSLHMWSQKRKLKPRIGRHISKEHTHVIWWVFWHGNNMWWAFLNDLLLLVLTLGQLCCFQGDFFKLHQNPELMSLDYVEYLTKHNTVHFTFRIFFLWPRRVF